MGNSWVMHIYILYIYIYYIYIYYIEMCITTYVFVSSSCFCYSQFLFPSISGSCHYCTVLYFTEFLLISI